MRFSKKMAVTASGCAMVAAVAMPAAAGAHPATSKHGTFSSTLNTHTVKPGTKLVLKGKGAEKSTLYTCVLTVLHGKKAYVHIVGSTTSTSKGKVTCTTKFEPFKGVPASNPTGPASKHSCPLSKKDKKAGGWKCGFAVSTLDQSSNSIQYFTAKK